MSVIPWDEARLNRASRHELRAKYEEYREALSATTVLHRQAIANYQATLADFDDVFIKVEMIDQIVESLLLSTEAGPDTIESIWGLFGQEELGVTIGLASGAAVSLGSLVAAIYRLGRPLASVDELAKMTRWARFRHGPTARWLGLGGAVFGVVTAGFAIGLSINANNVMKAHYREIIPQYANLLIETQNASEALNNAEADMRATLVAFLTDLGIPLEPYADALATLKAYLGGALRRVGEASALVDTATRILCRNLKAAPADIVSDANIIVYTGLSQQFVTQRRTQVNTPLTCCVLCRPLSATEHECINDCDAVG